jgi:hypothetical protein
MASKFKIPEGGGYLDVIKKRASDIEKKEVKKDKREQAILYLTIGLFIETLIIIYLTILLL